MKMDLRKVICPACGQKVEAKVWDGRVRGYCAVAKQYVDFVIETPQERTQSDVSKQLWQDPEYRAKVTAAAKKMWQDPEYRAKQRAARRNKGAGANLS
jgi:endogenous inhibitor of DNA gyrase (YacG/DUF329 family)